METTKAIQQHLYLISFYTCVMSPSFRYLRVLDDEIKLVDSTLKHSQ